MRFHLHHKIFLCNILSSEALGKRKQEDKIMGHTKPTASASVSSMKVILDLKGGHSLSVQAENLLDLC
jgi:hypothetical protein